MQDLGQDHDGGDLIWVSATQAEEAARERAHDFGAIAVIEVHDGDLARHAQRCFELVDVRHPAAHLFAHS